MPRYGPARETDTRSSCCHHTLSDSSHSASEWIHASAGLGDRERRRQGEVRYNAKLKALLKDDPSRHTNFTFSILRTVPKTLTKKEVVAVESVYKRKLGTRAFGLNEN
jgi:hypothetical protein